MAATTIFPLAQWAEGTNQNSTPANDNALRVQAISGPALGFAPAVPGSPANYDEWVVSGTGWGGFAVANIVIYLNGTWKEFLTFDGMVKAINGAPWFRHAGAWHIISLGS